MFFWKKKDKCAGKILALEDTDLIIIEYKGCHYELNAKKGLIRYRNIISPRDGGMEFPEDFFDERSSNIDEEDLRQIAEVFVSFITKTNMMSELPLLPPGATFNAYMKIESDNRTTYYTDTNIEQGGFGVNVKPILNEFIQLEHVLSEYCEFPEYIPVGKPTTFSSDVSNHLKRQFEISSVEKIIGFRYDATGVFGYEFYNKNDKLCTVSSVVVPSPPVTIYGFDNEWESEFKDCKIYAGLTRYVLDRKSKSQVAKVVYRDFGKYEINESISVYCDTKKYKFFYEDDIIADIGKFEGDIGWRPESKDYEYEAYFEIKMLQGINSELKMLIMAFPMIRFVF